MTKREKLLHNLTQKEYSEGARLALANAHEFMLVAELCRSRNLFAKGAANVVFALEEMAKAAYLQLKALNPHIDITNLASFFHKHDVKHKGLLALIVALNTSDENSSDIPSKSTDENKWSSGLVIILFIGLVVYLLLKQKQSGSGQPEEQTNWKKASRTFYEFIRQMGLYVEFDESERSWMSPSEAISESLFEAEFEQAQSWLTAIQEHLFGDQATAERALEIAEALANEHVLTQAARQQLNQENES